MVDDMDEPHAKGGKPDTKITYCMILFIGNIQKRPTDSYRTQIGDCVGRVRIAGGLQTSAVVAGGMKTF